MTPIRGIHIDRADALMAEKGDASPCAGDDPVHWGRETTLAGIAQALAGGPRVQLIPAVPSQGGLGLSRTARQYLAQTQDSYGHIGWIRASTPLLALLDLAALAGPLGLRAAQHKKLHRAVDAVLAWFEQHDGWVLVFDDVGGPECVTPYLDRLVRGRVILTSAHELPQGGPAVRIGPLARHETLGLLAQETGEPPHEFLFQLAEALGDLPIAVSLAVAYIRAAGVTVCEYLARLLRTREELFGSPKRPLPQSGIVLMVLTLSKAALAEGHPVAPKLLALLSHLAPGGIPEDFLRETGRCCPRSIAEALQDRGTLEALLGALDAYRLIERDGGTVMVHPLIARAVPARMTKEAAARCVETALRMVCHVFPQQDAYEHTRHFDTLLRQGLAAAEHAERLEIAPELAGAVRSRTALYLRCNGLLEEARAGYALALVHGEKAYGPNHLIVATRANNLGAVLRELGRHEEARGYYEKAYSTMAAVCDADDPNVAPCLNNLCLVAEDLGDLEGAERYYREALQLYERVCGPDDPHVAVALGNLGRVLRALGRREEARRHYERALRIDASAGPENPRIAARLANLGAVLFELGHHAEARTALERALAIDMNTNGAEHLSTARDLGLLGLVLKAQNDLPGARTMLQRALTIEAHHARGDGNRAADLAVQLGKIHKALGDLRRARMCFERALAHHDSRPGANNEDLLHDLSNLANVMIDQADLEAAQNCAERALKIAETSFGPRAPRTAFFVSRLGQVLVEQGRHAAARACFERAHAIDTAAHGPMSAAVARDLNNLGRVLLAMGNSTTAFAHFTRAYEIARTTLGDRHPRTRAIRANLDTMLV